MNSRDRAPVPVDPGNGDDDDLEDDLFDRRHGIGAIARFAQLVTRLPWFAAVGAELDEDEIEFATSYVAALGFPHVAVAAVADWEEAEGIAANTDWNSEWWEAEEALRMALIADAVALTGEDEVGIALTHLSGQIAEVVHEAALNAARNAGIGDEELIRAAAGAATQACYQAGLVLAAQAEDEHAFSLKFRLFEMGRWPLGAIGGTFHLF